MAGSKVDPAILSALRLDPATTRIASHGGSGFASTFKLTSDPGNGAAEKNYFVKTGSDDTMFRGEHASLNAIHGSVPSLCPKSHAFGQFEGNKAKWFMVTDFLDLGGGSSFFGFGGKKGGESEEEEKGTGMSLAAKLAKLHTTPAPIPESEGFDKPMFGFPVSTCCGSTPQDNSWEETWAEFYAERRLRAVLRAGIKENGSDAELSRTVEQTAGKVVPRLLGDGGLTKDGRKVTPVVVHGDLWSGNHGRGRIAGRGGTEEVVFDPSAVYGHSEYELGIMRMFGGFGASFFREYNALVPKDEPKEEWDDRVALYELYHHLNHWAIFGGGYRSGAMSIMRKLNAKYG